MVNPIKIMRKNSTLFLLNLLFICSIGYAKDWGSPPEGFSWHENQEARIAIPVPDGWHVKEDVRDKTAGIFISEEPIRPGDEFTTGYTLNFVDNFSTKNSVGPTQYAAQFIVAAENRELVILEPWLQDLADGIRGMGIRYLDVDAEPAAIVHYYIIADETDDSLRVSIFEAPEESWNEAWQHGEVMLRDAQLWRD